MGIPSYYKKLIDTVPGLVSKEHPLCDVNWLFMDFNCLIYHCIPKIVVESEFIDSIITYCLKVIKEVNPKNVFIAIDGVVPMAKMRQQRLRRFKSAWLSEKKDWDKEWDKEWDKNAITPGTYFMTNLKKALETMLQPNWILSSSDEPGEGEHKIMALWRKGTCKGNFVVYGLDADLIVLSMLGHECYNIDNIWLFREEIDQKNGQKNDQKYNWFSINILKQWLTINVKNPRTFILNYCFALSILGNDFLPSSLGLKMRDDGHHELLRVLTLLTNSLIDPCTLAISLEGIIELFTSLSLNESVRITKYITKKQMMANTASDLNFGEHNWPLSQIKEAVLLDYKKLRRDWKDKYLAFFDESIHKICTEYIYGIDWVWAYYTGKNVCFNWSYSYHLPPLWEWLIQWLSTHSLPEQTILLRATDIKPVEQLALVLPLESWSLVPPCKERSLPIFAPQYYPATFSFESIGKRYFWECEALIPIPSIMEVKDIIKKNNI